MEANKHLLSNGTVWIADYDENAEDIRAFVGANKGTEVEDEQLVGGIHLYEHHMFRGRNLRDTLSRTKRIEKCRILTDGTTDVNFCHAEFYGPIEVEGQVSRVLGFALEAVIKESIHPYEHMLEQEICSEEFRIRSGEDIMAKAYEAAIVQAYAGTHYGRTCADDLANLPNLTVKQMFQIRDALFNPSNMTVVTVSNVPDEELAAHMERFSQRKDGVPTPTYTIPLPPRTGTIEENTKDIEDVKADTCYVQHIIRAMDSTAPIDLDELAALHVVKTIIAKGDSSFLYREMRLKRGQTYHVKGDVAMPRPEIILDLCYTAPPKFLASNLSIFTTALDKLTSMRMPMREFDRCRAIAADEFRREMEDDESRGRFYIDSSTINLFVPVEQLEDRIRAVTPALLRRTMETYVPGMQTVIMYPKPGVERMRMLSKEEALARRQAAAQT